MKPNGGARHRFDLMAVPAPFTGAAADRLNPLVVHDVLHLGGEGGAIAEAAQLLREHSDARIVLDLSAVLSDEARLELSNCSTVSVLDIRGAASLDLQQLRVWAQAISRMNGLDELTLDLAGLDVDRHAAFSKCLGRWSPVRRLVLHQDVTSALPRCWNDVLSRCRRLEHWKVINTPRVGDRPSMTVHASVREALKRELPPSAESPLPKCRRPGDASPRQVEVPISTVANKVESDWKALNLDEAALPPLPFEALSMRAPVLAPVVFTPRPRAALAGSLRNQYQWVWFENGVRVHVPERAVIGPRDSFGVSNQALDVLLALAQRPEKHASVCTLIEAIHTHARDPAAYVRDKVSEINRVLGRALGSDTSAAIGMRFPDDYVLVWPVGELTR